jgi:hypothetical protein
MMVFSLSTRSRISARVVEDRSGETCKLSEVEFTSVGPISGSSERAVSVTGEKVSTIYGFASADRLALGIVAQETRINVNPTEVVTYHGFIALSY